MKKLLLIVITGFLIYVFFREDLKVKSNQEQQQIEMDSVIAFYQEFPKEIIPFQIPYSDYFLEAKILSVKKDKLQNTFDKFQNLIIQYSIKNPYKHEIWIPIPMGLTITSNDYPKEDNWKRNNIHPHVDYQSNETIFIGKQPLTKFENNRLFYIAPEASLTLQTKFSSVPFSENLIICGLPVFVRNIIYEKGIIINLKNGSISGKQFFQQGYYLYLNED